MKVEALGELFMSSRLLGLTFRLIVGELASLIGAGRDF